MDELKLVIGNRNLSSWSLRPWLLLQHLGLPHQVVTVPLRQPDSALRIRRYSPSGKVPVMLVGGMAIWDSLAIGEWLAERHPGLWPADPKQRALARSVCCEMHSGFAALRTFLPMDFTARFGPPGRLLATVEADVDRIVAIWASCRRAANGAGPFLFGEFGIADAMFAPVCSRFTTYAVPLERDAQAYVETVMAMPAMQDWGRRAAAEVAGIQLVDEDEIPTVVLAPQPPPVAPPIEAPPVPRSAPPMQLQPAPPIPPQPVSTPPLRSAPPEPRPQPVAPLPRPPAPLPVAPAYLEVPVEPPAELRRAPRPIPSTVMVKPIGDGTRRRR